MDDSLDLFFPRKRWGQHFQVDPNITRKIIDACHLQTGDSVLEIGPGRGVLTQEIARRVQHLIAIERDPQLCRGLKERFSSSHATIIEADFLKYDLRNLAPPFKVIGNLPYYISSPIIVRLLEHHKQFTDLFFTVQLEFGRRLVAKVSTKDYSALSCLVQFYAEPKLLFKIKNTCFRPVPKVDSCFVHFSILTKPRFALQNQKLFFDIIRAAFQQRRKTIVNSLLGFVLRQAHLVPGIKGHKTFGARQDPPPVQSRGFAAKEQLHRILNSLKVPFQARAEDLTIQNYADIANVLSDEGG
jgi:16S rRNA (adenine1518-N6/adenine1519-N6)-dimethyltransferase